MEFILSYTSRLRRDNWLNEAVCKIVARPDRVLQLFEVPQTDGFLNV